MGRKKKEILIPPPCNSVHEYEKSDWWRNKSKQLLENKEATCAICGRRRWIWQPRKKQWKRNLKFCTHHKTYKNIPYEKEDDLLVLCNNCHTLCHDILRCKNISLFNEELAQIVQKYFIYDGINTFVYKNTKEDS